jgi:hypothetical protein
VEGERTAMTTGIMLESSWVEFFKWLADYFSGAVAVCYSKVNNLHIFPTAKELEKYWS